MDTPVDNPPKFGQQNLTDKILNKTYSEDIFDRHLPRNMGNEIIQKYHYDSYQKLLKANESKYGKNNFELYDSYRSYCTIWARGIIAISPEFVEEVHQKIRVFLQDKTLAAEFTNIIVGAALTYFGYGNCGEYCCRFLLEYMNGNRN